MIILFYGMTKGMPEVQEHPFSGVKLVMFHDDTFDVHTAFYDGRKFILKLCKRAVGFQCME